MVRLTQPQILAATAAIFTSVSAVSIPELIAPRAPYPNILLEKLITADSNITAMAQKFMLSTVGGDDNSDSARVSNAKVGYGGGLEQMLALGLIGFSFDYSQTQLKQDINATMEATRNIVHYFSNVNITPTANFAQECGVAIACQRNNVVNQLTEIANTYSQENPNKANPSASFSAINIPVQLPCSDASNLCSTQKGKGA
ncbi:hypothetical protein F4805DRAFT_208209 [Annulohypoxylon moriforme]|nr:hypothetical protein F4805DRAFT_208209 [Annulohypoxylon moriforme]